MIHRVTYNEMECDRCKIRILIWEGCSAMKEWLIRVEGKPWDGKVGGYHEAHYCPTCKVVVK